MNTILRLALAALFILCADIIIAQCSHDHNAADRNIKKELAELDRIEARYQSDLENLSKEFKKDFEKAYTYRKEYLQNQVSNGQFLFDTPINEVLERVFKKIAATNPDIDKEAIRVMLNRSSEVNAASYGDGTIDFNLGLFTHLQNEDQLAFVMCHEIAHYQRDHGNKAIARKVKKVNSKNFKSKVKDIKKSDFNQYSKTEELLDDLAFTGAKHSRLKEIEADRIGLEYYSNTGYDSIHAMTLLRVLDQSDNGDEVDVDIPTFFDFDAYVFNANWLNDETSFHENGKQKLRGRAARMANLKTHPDCEERIMEMADKQYDSLAYVHHEITPEMTQLRKIAQMEIIEFKYQRGNIGNALFRTIAMIQDGHDDQFLYGMVSKCFFELNNAQKNRAVGRILAAPHHSNHPDYNNLLTMLNNLTKEDVVQIHDAFYKERKCASAGTANVLTKEVNAYLQGQTQALSDNAMAMIGEGGQERFKKLNNTSNTAGASESKKSLSKKEKKSVGNIMDFSFSSLNPMIKDGKIRGYYLFYKKELKDKQTVAYEVIVYDQNLNQFAKKTITGSRDMFMLEGSYNGSAFCFKLYEARERKMIFKLFDNNFASLGSKKVQLLTDMSKMPLLGQTKSENDEIGEKTIFPIEGMGFATIVPNEDGGYGIKYYPHTKGEKGWTSDSDSTDDQLAFIKFVGQSSDRLFFEILKKKTENKETNGFAVLGIDKKTGDQKFLTYLNDDDHAYFVNSTSFDKATNSVMALCNYNSMSNLFTNPTGDGIANVRIDANGEVAQRDHISWKEDVSEFLKVDDDGKIEHQGHVFPHKIIRGYDGKNYIVGEFYNRESGNLITEDLLLLVLDEAFNLIGAKTQEKNAGKHKLPGKSSNLPDYVVAKLVRLNRGFDYSYTLTDDNAENLTICYQDKPVDKKDMGTVFKMVTVNKDGSQAEDQIVLNNQSRTIRIMPGKEGFFVVAEYDFLDKSLSLRQERVAY